MPLDPCTEQIVLAALHVASVEVAVVALLVPPGTLELLGTRVCRQVVIVTVLGAESLTKLTTKRVRWTHIHQLLLQLKGLMP